MLTGNFCGIGRAHHRWTRWQPRFKSVTKRSSRRRPAQMRRLQLIKMALFKFPSDSSNTSLLPSALDIRVQKGGWLTGLTKPPQPELTSFVQPLRENFESTQTTCVPRINHTMPSKFISVSTHPPNQFSSHTHSRFSSHTHSRFSSHTPIELD